MEKGNTFKIWLFILFLLTVIIGGYFGMQKFLDEHKQNNNKNNVITNNTAFTDIRIDTTKDYIYFTNEDMVAEDFDISFPIVNINFRDDSNIAEQLNSKTEDLKKDSKYNSDNELEYAKYPAYSIYVYDNYISLICDYYTYSDDMLTYNSSSIYVFDKYTNELYTSGRLLTLFNTSADKIKTKVKSFVSDADLINGDETLDIDSTLANLSMDKLFIDKMGRLSISIIVKSSEKDYNDIVVLS